MKLRPEETHFVYRYVDEYGLVQYVGRTNDLENRHKCHCSPSADKNWAYFCACKLEYMRVCTKADSDLLETYFILKYEPPLNKGKKDWGFITFDISPLPEWKAYDKSPQSEVQHKYRADRCKSCWRPIQKKDLRYINHTVKKVRERYGVDLTGNCNQCCINAENHLRAAREQQKQAAESWI